MQYCVVMGLSQKFVVQSCTLPACPVFKGGYLDFLHLTELKIYWVIKKKTVFNIQTSHLAGFKRHII